jgi:hypothetical protein
MTQVKLRFDCSLVLLYAIVVKNFVILVKILLFEKIYRKDVTILWHADDAPRLRRAGIKLILADFL